MASGNDDVYPEIDPAKGYSDPSEVLSSYFANRDLYRDVDDQRQKCLRFVHGQQWDKDVEAKRNSAGIPSAVFDSTLEVYKTLDGFARKNRTDVKFIPVGTDDYAAANMRNELFASLRSSSNLHAFQAKTFGNAAIFDEGYLYIYPHKNILGELEPCLYVPDAFEVYPDANSKDPVKMSDADFIDLPRFMHPRQAYKELRGYVDDTELMEQLRNYRSRGSYDHNLTTNQSLDRSGDNRYERNGQVLVIRRFYKVQKAFKRLVDLESGDSRDFDPAEEAMATPEVLGAMNLKLDEGEEEWVWCCILIPAVSTEKFFTNDICDFQPVDPTTTRKNWPIIRLPHLLVGGKAVGAISAILKLQENKNIVMSSLIHHLQTAANGGMGYEADAFGGDSEEERKFKEERNRAGASIKFGPGGRDKVFPLVKGELAFADGGQFLLEILKQTITNVSGAQPILQGRAQSQSAASLYKQQTERASDVMLGITEMFKEFQWVVAEVLHSFVQQFYTEERVLAMEGNSETTQQLVINKQTALGIINDVSQGLYSVRKTEAPATETARRARLADNIEILRALIETQMPAFLLPYNSVIENMEVSPEVKSAMGQDIDAWKAMQGLSAAGQAGMAGPPGMPPGPGAPQPSPQGAPMEGTAPV